MASSYYHPVGTCKMAHDDDPLGVVDSKLRLVHYVNFNFSVDLYLFQFAFIFSFISPKDKMDGISSSWVLHF